MNMVTKLFFCIRRSFKGLKDDGYSVCFIFTHISRTFHQRVIFQAVTTKPSPKTGNLCKISSVGPSKSSTSSCSDLLPPSSASSSRRPSGSFQSSPALISNSSDEQSTKPCSPTSLPPRPSISSLGCKVLAPFQPHAINFQSNHTYNETHS